MPCPQCGDQTFLGAKMCWSCHAALSGRSPARHREIGHVDLNSSRSSLKADLILLGATLGLSGAAAVVSAASGVWLPLTAIAPLLAVPLLIGAFFARRAVLMAAVGTAAAWFVAFAWGVDASDVHSLPLLALSTALALAAGAALGWLTKLALPDRVNPYRLMPTGLTGIALAVVFVGSLPAAGLVYAKTAEARWVDAAWCSVTLTLEEAGLSTDIGRYDALHWATTMRRVAQLDESIVVSAPAQYSAAAVAYQNARGELVVPGDAAGLLIVAEAKAEVLREHSVPQQIAPCRLAGNG